MIGRGDLNAAAKAYASAITAGSCDPDVFNNLAAVYDKWGGRAEEQFQLLCRAHDLAPGSPAIRNNLVAFARKRTAALVKEERFREAMPLVEKWVEVDRESAPAHRELGLCRWKSGKLEDAMLAFTRAINLDPNNALYYNDLGLVCFELRLLSEAQGAFQEVLRLNPQSVMSYTHLGLLANLTGLTGLAISFLKRALDIDPNCSAALNNLALFLRDQGEQVECRQRYLQAIELKPDNTRMLSGYLLALNDDPDADPAWVAQEHRRFQSVVAREPRVIEVRDRDPDRKLRVGYISPDFRLHSVAFFIAPTIEGHDKESVEVTCYSTGLTEDKLTERIRAAAGRFRNAFRMSDEDLAALIREDEIDILVELSGHTADNRLGMLANRAAPVQMTYLGYPNTTGINAMDYRITDGVADPVGAGEAWYTEKLVRVEGGFLAYQPAGFARDLPVSLAPARDAGYVTFGSFNNLAKINHAVLDTWASILEQVPGSVILLKARGLRTDQVKERIAAAFAARGVDAEKRVRLLGHERAAADHMRVYNQIDLALDTFPYNGTTTTCEALWMGTPVLSFEGVTHASRVGASILTHVGLPELVAKDRQGYIDKAVSLGKDLDALAKLRSGLREKFAASPVMDASRLARGLEKAYREAWQAYCASAR